MSDDLLHVHPETGEPTRIVTGVMSPMTADNMRIGGRAVAHGRARVLFDLSLAKEIAGRYVGPAAEAHLGRVLMKLIDGGAVPLEQMPVLIKVHRDFLHAAEGVISGKPNVLAVEWANRIVSPGGMMQIAGDGTAGDLAVLAYAVLQLDEEQRLDAASRLVIGGVP